MPYNILPGLLRFLKGISFRILFFNVLIVSFAVFFFFGMNSFERLMLAELEINLNEQARGLSNMLSLKEKLDKPGIRKAVDAQPWAYRSFVQVFDQNSVLVYQSRPSKWETGPDPSDIKQKFLYEFAATIYGFLPGGSTKPLSTPQELKNKEKQDVAKALQRKPSTGVIRHGFENADVVVVSTFPIRAWKHVKGAVRVHRSANRILMAVYQFRWSTLKITLLLVLGTLLLNIVLSLTILKPIKRLTDETKTILQFKDPEKMASLQPVDGFDEIKQLSLSMSHLTTKLATEVIQHREFVDDLVHELNNPLTSIRSACEMSELAENPDEKQRFQHMIAANMTRIDKLLSGVKDLNHIRRSNTEQKLPSVDIGNLTKDYVQNIALLLPSKIVLHIDGDSSLKVRIDEDRYIQLLDNLVQNAAGFSPESEPIRVDLKADHLMITLKVEDRGIGIPPEYTTKIFDRFFSLRKQNQSKKHSGLGLAIAKSITENSGGRISVTNNPQGGACFKVVLPC